MRMSKHFRLNVSPKDWFIRFFTKLCCFALLIKQCNLCMWMLGCDVLSYKSNNRVNICTYQLIAFSWSCRICRQFEKQQNEIISMQVLLFRTTKFNFDSNSNFQFMSVSIFTELYLKFLEFLAQPYGRKSQNWWYRILNIGQWVLDLGMNLQIVLTYLFGRGFIHISQIKQH